MGHLPYQLVQGFFHQKDQGREINNPKLRIAINQYPPVLYPQEVVGLIRGLLREMVVNITT